MSTNLVNDLLAEVETLIRDLQGEPAARWLFDGRASREEYTVFLQQTYHYVRWTQPLLERAGRRLAALGRAPGLASLFARKAREEDHHERWALADLGALGRDTRAARRSPPSPAVRAYVAWNRLCVEAGAPEGFLGTAFVLEGLSIRCARQAAENLIAHSGIPGIERAVRFLRGHAAADAHHVGELSAVLEGVEDPQAREAMVLSARVTRAIYPRLVTTEQGKAAIMEHGASSR